MRESDQTKLPLLALRRAARKMHDRSTKSLQTWARQKPASILEKNRKKARSYMLAIGYEVMNQMGHGPPGHGIMGRSLRFLAKHPGIREQFDRVAHAISTIVRDHEIREWAQASRIDLRDLAMRRRLLASFGGHIVDVAWDKSFYPEALMEGKKAAKDWPNVAAQLARRMIERLEADKAIVFAHIFPRRPSPRLPPSLRTLTY